jgi:hypothetical protein
MSRPEDTDSERAARLAHLRMEHRDLDVAIDALRSLSAPDQLQIARLKKRKLRLRDEIAMIEDLMIPDIIA